MRTPRYPDGMNQKYTWGVKSRACDTVLLYNLSKQEAQHIEFTHPELRATLVSTKKLKPRDPYVRQHLIEQELYLRQQSPEGHVAPEVEDEFPIEIHQEQEWV